MVTMIEEVFGFGLSKNENVIQKVFIKLPAKCQKLKVKVFFFLNSMMSFGMFEYSSVPSPTVYFLIALINQNKSSGSSLTAIQS